MVLEEKLNEYLKGNYPTLSPYLREREIDDISDLFKLDPNKRIDLILDFCKRNNLNFNEIYGAIEKAYEEKMRENALKAAVAAILAREGNAPVSDPAFTKAIKEKIKKIKKYDL